MLQIALTCYSIHSIISKVNIKKYNAGNKFLVSILIQEEIRTIAFFPFYPYALDLKCIT